MIFRLLCGLVLGLAGVQGALADGGLMGDFRGTYQAWIGNDSWSVESENRDAAGDFGGRAHVIFKDPEGPGRRLEITVQRDEKNGRAFDATIFLHVFAEEAGVEKVSFQLPGMWLHNSTLTLNRSSGGQGIDLAGDAGDVNRGLRLLEVRYRKVGAGRRVHVLAAGHPIIPASHGRPATISRQIKFIALDILLPD